MARAFGSYLVVDWSASNAPAQGPNSIWWALVRPGADPVLANPSTRAEAETQITDLILSEARAGRRVLAGFDFPFGYPAGFAATIAPHGTWVDVWARLAEEISDGPDNANNRFEAAARLNAVFPGDGPFWGYPHQHHGRYEGLPFTCPNNYGGAMPARYRLADSSASSAQEVWKLSGAGSVGGQALTGLPVLDRLRRAVQAAVWPFEGWEGRTVPVLAEVYPSLVDVPQIPGRVHDAVQVESLARAFCALDGQGRLGPMLASADQHPADVVTHEATILGLGYEALLGKAVKAAIDEMTEAASAEAPPMRPYIRDPQAIYAQSFATVRAEANLDRFTPAMASLATRIIHACGMVEVADRLAYTKNAFDAGRAALSAGAPVLCDCEMVGAGIIRRYLPADNEVIVTLNDPTVPDLAKAIGNTRSAAAVELWQDHLEGSVVAIGNAPTALFHLLELLDAGAPKPAVILGFPVGFVGAAESKAELARNPRGSEFIALRGRRGGSAIASAAVNALAAGLPEDRG